MKFLGDESSLLVGMPISEGVASPIESSNQKLKGCFFSIRNHLVAQRSFASLEEVSSLDPEPPTLLLEGFQIEGLTPRNMLKVQSMLES